jgi:phosphopantothenoylcysteine decarboxylase / phosphopantothenate---cysteine ligase
MPGADEPRQAGRVPLRGAHVLLGVTGGIAAYKAAELARALGREGATVQPLLTASAERFVTRATFAALTGRRVPASVWDDPEGVEHVELARWADVLVIAPATAHTIARLAGGFADDILTNVALAFGGPLVVAPAMHTEMWRHPATQANLRLLRERGALVVEPASGPLTSGDIGVGRLAELPDVIEGVTAALGRAGGPAAGPLAGVRVLVSLGGTREAIDPVRYIGNRSSGRMGAAIVAEALQRGAEVVAVAAATSVEVPAGARRVDVESAQQLYDAVTAQAPGCDLLIMAAAVADFRPKTQAEQKLKKDRGVPEVILEPTPDTLAELGRSRLPGQILIGFAAETENHVEGGRSKLERKRLDLIVVNHVERADSAFGAGDATAYLVDATGVEPLRHVPKREVARRLLDWAQARLSG